MSDMKTMLESYVHAALVKREAEVALSAMFSAGDLKAGDYGPVFLDGKSYVVRVSAFGVLELVGPCREVR